LLHFYVTISPSKCNMADELHFKGKDPGAVRHGNFINYYQFNSAESRLHLLPSDLWTVKTDQRFVCLDIGCNSGVNIFVNCVHVMNFYVIDKACSSRHRVRLHVVCSLFNDAFSATNTK
jgi:hypothetical protein